MYSILGELFLEWGPDTTEFKSLFLYIRWCLVEVRSV